MEGEALPTSPPSAESVLQKTSGSEPTNAEQKPEQNMTSREEASLKLRDAGDVVRRYKEEGFFGKEGEDKYRRAQTALLYQGTGGASTKEASLQLQAMIDSIREIEPRDPQAQELNSFFSENIKVFNQTDGKTYSLNDWEEQINVIKNDNSLSEEDRVNKIEELKQEAFYGFLLQKEEAQTQEQRNSAKNLISKYKESFEQRVKEQGDNVNEKDMQTFVMLGLAEAADGEAGVILKHEALKNLREDHGTQGLDKSIDFLGKQVPEALDKMCKLMPEKMALEFRNAVAEDKLEEMIKNGKLSKIEGFPELLFGKDFTDGDLKKLIELGEKKKLKNALLIALVIMLGSMVEMGKEIVPLPK